MPTPEDIATFAGKNGQYYARAWVKLTTPGASNAGFNGAAFFFNYTWILYRRLYDIAALFGAVIVIEAVSSEWYFTHHPNLAEAQKSWDLLVRVTSAIVVGQFGNLWYLRHAARSIEYARSRQLDLARSGGTSTAAVFIGTAAIFIAVGIAYFVYGLIEAAATQG